MPRSPSSWRAVGAAAVICAAGPAPVAALGAPALDLAPWRAPAAATQRCATSGLVVWLDTRGEGAAGSTYYRLEFTNLSGRACSLRGYPGVSAVDLRGRRLGSAASRNRARPRRTVVLASGATAGAVLQIVDARNFPRAACRPTHAAGLLVYPPAAHASRLVPFPFLACARTGPVSLTVQAVAPG